MMALQPQLPMPPSKLLLASIYRSAPAARGETLNLRFFTRHLDCRLPAASRLLPRLSSIPILTLPPFASHLLTGSQLDSKRSSTAQV